MTPSGETAVAMTAIPAATTPASPNDGPPDLEDLWRDFNRKLNGMFGNKRRGGGGNGGGDGPRMPQIDFNPKFLVAVSACWRLGRHRLAGLGLFYIVDASQRGLVLQFGSFKETTEPGLRWRMPYPIQSHELVNLTGADIEIGYRGSERNKVLKGSLMLTDDENIVNIQFAVQYILKDPVEYLSTTVIPMMR